MPFFLLALALAQAPSRPLDPVFASLDAGASDSSGTSDDDASDQLPPPLRSPPVDSTADQLSVDTGSQRTLLHGHARLYSRGILLRADDVDYDPIDHRASAQGDVILTYGLFAASADSAEVDLTNHLTVLHGATLYQKLRFLNADALSQVDTAAQLRLLGKNVLTLRADVIRRISAKHYRADTIWITGCDCHSKDWLTEPPSWSVRGSNADIEPGNRLTLSWGRLLIKDVPTVPVPYLFLPLSDRQTGFLLPHPNYTSNNGFQLEEPFFWAINKWSDATFDPGYFFGVNHTPNGGDPNNPDDNPGMQGPRLAYELRYIPSTDTHGILTGALVDDHKGLPDGTHRDIRGDFSWIHDQKLGFGFSDHLELQGVSDQKYFGDVTPDVIMASTQFLRSDARIDHHTESTSAYAAASFYQDFDVPRANASLGTFFGPHDVNALTFQRLPALGYTYEERMLGPFALSLDASAARYAPLSEEQPRSNFYIPVTPKYQAGAAPYATNREVSDRVDAAPQIRLPLTLGRFGEIAPYASLHEDAWLTEGNTTSERTYAEVGTTAQTELSRVFSSGTVLYRNVITPMAEVRAVPWARDSLLSGSPLVLWKNGAPLLANDEYDNALPQTQTFFQTVLAVRSRLDRKVGKAITTPIAAEIGQGYDLLGRRPADSYLNLNLTQGPAAFVGQVRYDPNRHEVDSINTSITLSDTAWVGRTPVRPGAPAPTGSSITLAYRRMAFGLADPERATLAELVGSLAPPELGPGGQLYQAEELDLSGTWKVPAGLSINGGAGFLPHVALTSLNTYALTPLNPAYPGMLQSSIGTASTRVLQIEDGLLSYHLGVDYGSPCGCWGLHAAAVFQPQTAAGSGAATRAASSFYAPASFVFSLEANRIAGPF